jgi:hypothetical protein
MKLSFSRQIFEKGTGIKFHQNPSSLIRVVSRGRTDRRTDMKLIVAFCNFSKALKGKMCCVCALCHETIGRLLKQLDVI